MKKKPLTASVDSALSQACNSSNVYCDARRRFHYVEHAARCAGRGAEWTRERMT